MASPPSQSLLARTARGAGFNFAANAFGQIVRLGSNLILTRLLAPELFGIMAIAIAVWVGLEQFTDLGVAQSIMRSKNAERIEYLRTAWMIQIVRSFLLSIICGLIAVAIWVTQLHSLAPPESVYGDPNLPFVVGLMCVSTLVSGFASIQIFVAERRIEYKKVAIYTTCVHLISTTVIVCWALYAPSIWALAGGLVTGTLINVVLSHVFFRSSANWFGWNSPIAWEIFHFGKWIALSSLLGFLGRTGDRFILGFILTKLELGIYVIAIMLMEAALNLAWAMRRALFAGLSEANRVQPERRSEVYYKIRQFLDPALFFCAGFLMCTGDTIVEVLYDQRYAEAGWMLQILAISLALSIYELKYMLMLVDGDSLKYTMLRLVTTVALFAGIPLGHYFFGFSGAIIGVAIAPVFALPLVFAFFVQRTRPNFVREIMFLPVILVGVLAGKLSELALDYLVNLAA